MKVLAQNRKAHYNYTILSTLEAGIVLVGSEVKVLRGGQGSLAEAFAVGQEGEIFLHNFFIPEYQNSRQGSHEPRRQRKLLLRSKEIRKLLGSIQKQGYALVPLKVYLNKKSCIKVLLGLARGNKSHDKRDVIKERDWQRQKERLLKVTS